MALAAAPVLYAQESQSGDFPLKDGMTVVFFGDSITQAGLYVAYVDAFLAARFPERTIRVLNRGISSETISGTSEPDHVPRRPDAHVRFDRDVAAVKPDVVVACFGMNDGNYHPFEQERFAKYQAGVRRLIARVRELRAELVLLTPPPFDPYSRLVLDPDARSYGYKFPAIEYDETLERYSDWLLKLNEPGVRAVDLHTPMNQHLQERRRKRVSFRFQKDGIHPDATGHWLMAQALLKVWRVSPVASEVLIDRSCVISLSNGMGDLCSGVDDLRRRDGRLTFKWRTPLPMPEDEDWDSESLTLERARHRLNRHQLTVVGLDPGKYRLSADGTGVAEVTPTELASGLDLLAYPAFPTTRAARELLGLVQQRQRLEVALWRKRAVGTAPAEDRDILRPEQELEAELKRLDAKIDDLRRPRGINIEITAIAP
jgi:lysophospholipase L1-like esterase